MHHARTAATSGAATTARKLAAILTCAVLVATVGCSSGKKAAKSPSHRTTTSTSSAPAKATTTTAPKDPAPGVPVSPLTGLTAVPPLSAFRPALAVKIDNLDISHETARPQAGLVQADVVFEEIVEGNITRLIGVFQSKIPRRIGPVRSARTTDPILLSQLNRPLFAWSGGNGYVVGAVHASPLRDFGEDAFPSAFSRDRTRPAPHNLFLDPVPVFKAAPADAKWPEPMFFYRKRHEPLSSVAQPTKGVRITFGGGAASPIVTYQYDARADTWRRGQNGTTHVDDTGAVVAPSNVVILFTDYRSSPADARSPEAVSVGTGVAWVFTHGHVIVGSWTRPTPDVAAVLKDLKGAVIKLTRGRTWVELPRPGGASLLH